MITNKKISVSYNRIEAAEENYFANIRNTFEDMLKGEQRSESFEAGELTYTWVLMERIEAAQDADTYFFKLAKEITTYPAGVNDNSIMELMVEGTLANVQYALFCPTYKAILTMGLTGRSSRNFKKLLGQFSPEGVVRFNPIFEDKIDEKVMNWDSYKKVSISLNMPSGDDVKEFASTKTGELMKLFGYLVGLKLDISVSSGSGKESLSSMMVKDLLPELLANDLCTSLTVKGSDFENTSSEQYDLKNAAIKYQEQIEIEGNYLQDSDAKQLLLRAFNERASLLFKED